MLGLFRQFRERRLIEWMLAYVAGALLVLEIVDFLEPRWGISASASRGIDVAVGIGFFIALVLAWFHGARGRQEPTGPELLILTLLLMIASLLLALVVDEPFLTRDEAGRQGASVTSQWEGRALATTGAADGMVVTPAGRG